MKKIQNFKVNSNQEFDFFFVRLASSILEGKSKISYDFVNHKYSDFFKTENNYCVYDTSPDCKKLLMQRLHHIYDKS